VVLETRSFTDGICDPWESLCLPAAESTSATKRSGARWDSSATTAISPQVAAPSDVAFARAGPGDGPAIEAMLARCTPRSLSDRFFRPVSKAPQGYLDQVLTDRDVHLAFLIQRHGEVIGLAELHRTGSQCGDLALIVEDAYHGRGIGAAAFGLLTGIARRLDIQILTADVRIENGVVLRALRRAGKATVTRARDICHVEVHIGSLEGE
jgi:hypothetical protein